MTARFSGTGFAGQRNSGCKTLNPMFATEKQKP
jgi:hypothetical protein